MSFIPPVLAIAANASTTLSGAHKLYQVTNSKDCTAAAHLHRGRGYLDSAINIIDGSANDLKPHEVVKFSEEHIDLRQAADDLETKLPLTKSLWRHLTWSRYQKKKEVHVESEEFERDASSLNTQVKRSSALARSKRLVRDYGGSPTNQEESSGVPSASESVTPVLRTEHAGGEMDADDTENIELQIPMAHISLADDIDYPVDANPFSDPRTCDIFGGVNQAHSSSSNS